MIRRGGSSRPAGKTRVRPTEGRPEHLTSYRRNRGVAATCIVTAARIVTARIASTACVPAATRIRSLAVVSAVIARVSFASAATIDGAVVVAASRCEDEEKTEEQTVRTQFHLCS
jgi:hypothetical protein